ncbi:zingipain-2-like [Triticum dicoccoides]|uniref:zingipain-2-like n=1 Tax=Triticum dicoccoides TaxID=85692 RepID=UPI00188EA1B7|nr:zingipain-2-like [Triticum dicoccoides]
MFRRVFVAAGRTMLRRFCSQSTAAGWPSRHAGATMVPRFYSQTAPPAESTLFRRFHGQTTAAGSPWRPAGAAMVRRFGSQAAVARSLSRPAGATTVRQFCSQAAVVGLRRLCSPAVAAGSLSRPAGARLMQLQFQRNVGHVAATAAHRLGFFRRYAIPIAIAVGVGLWCMKKNAELVERRKAELAERASRPSRIDWVEAGVVTRAVRNQKNCASVEAVHYLKTFQSIALSVQELVDCNIENHGCNGGDYLYVFRYVRQNGLLAESSYPYKARKSICRKLDKKAAARISGFRYIRPTEDDLEKAVAKRPVIVTVQGDPLQEYRGGIMDCKFDRRLTGWHAVLVVGYGTDSYGVKYWRIKNSWGKHWGEGGYARIRRHVADKRGVLGIFMFEPVYPVLTT